MTKNIWIGLLVLVIVIGSGVLEVVLLKKQFDNLKLQCDNLVQKCKEQTLTKQQFDDFDKQWVKLREKSELALPHVDLYELNLRFAEARAYADQQDYNQLHAQLAVIDELLDYVPHLMIPTLRHIV